jgi:RNA polymerase sigma-70 factor (ECF subfamily)
MTLKRNKRLSYEQLIEPAETLMMRSIWRIVRNREVAEDTLQDAFITIWRKLERILIHPNPRAFILKICVNAAYDSLRKQGRRSRHEMQDFKNQDYVHSNSSVQEELEQKNMQAEILDAVRRLPRKQALAVLMRIVQGLPYDDIAQAMGCSEVTVRGYVFKGRTRLNRWLSHLNPASGKEVLK